MAKHSFILVNSWHDSNKGDAAILQGTLWLLSHIASGSEITVIPCIDQRSPLIDGVLRHTLVAFRSLKVHPPALPAFPRRREDWILKVPRAILKLLFPKLIPSFSAEKEIERRDIVIVVGGLYLAFPHKSLMRPPIRLFAYLYPAIYASRLGKKVIFFGHSLGPFKNLWSRLLMRWAFNKASIVVTRESLSAELAGALTGNQVKIRVAPDPAFYLQKSPSGAVDTFICKEIGSNSSFAVLAPRSLGGYGHTLDNEDRLLQGFLAAIKYLNAKGLQTVLIAHTLGPTRAEDDRVIVQTIARRAEQERVKVSVFEEDLSPSELMYMYSRASVVISVRFHGAVLALASGTPAVVVPYYGTKAQGAFADLNLAHLAVSVARGFERRLLQAIDDALTIPRSVVESLGEAQRKKLQEIGWEAFC